jgi:hypothetical protein
MSALATELAGKRVELLKEIVPRAVHAAVLWNSSIQAKVTEWQETQEPARRESLTLRSFEARSPEELDGALAAIGRDLPGDRGEHTLVLERLDMITVPRGENRSFRNISNELGRLLVMIVPETDEQADPISYAPSLAKEIEGEYGKAALAGLQKIGFKFEDEPSA